MPIPLTRQELTDAVANSYEKLSAELDRVNPELETAVCVDDWSVKDVLAVREWWTRKIVDWIEAGQQGKTPTTPARGYSWRDTPRLNADICKKCERRSFQATRKRLARGVQRVLATIDALTERELLEPGVFDWAGKWPISRWISINTARQYTTARTYIRRITNM